MSLFASRGLDVRGGLGDEEYDKLVERRGSTEGLVYRVVSQPSFLPTASGIVYTQYTTIFSHNLQAYVDHGWKDQGFESTNEHDCIDWINAMPDCSLQAVLRNDPELPAKLAVWRPASADQKRQQDMRRGKYL